MGWDRQNPGYVAYRVSLVAERLGTWLARVLGR